MNTVTLTKSVTGSHHFRCDGRLVWIDRGQDVEDAITSFISANASFFAKYPTSIIIREDYNPKQPRDARGRWTSGGGGGRRGGGGKRGLAAKKVSELQDIAKKEGIDVNTLSHKSRKSVLTAAIKAKRRGQDLRKAGLLKATKVKTSLKKSREGTHKDVVDYDQFPDLAIAQLSKRLGISHKKAEFTAETLFDWSDEGYERIKEIQKKGKTSRKIKAIDKYLEKMPSYRGEVSRGISFRSETEKQNFLNSIQQNGVELRSHSSFSSNKDISLDFAANIHTGFSAPHGALMVVKNNKSGASIKSFSRLKEEDEVIVPKGTKYKVLRTGEKVSRNGKKIEIIELEEI